MEETKKIWMNGSLVDWKDATTHVLSHTLHYGAGVFEGIRFYKTDKGPAIFRLKEHIERLFSSASAIHLAPGYSKEDIEKAIIETVKANNIDAGYIRPLMYFGYGKMGLNPTGADVDVVIAVWPWGAYLGEKAVNVKISKYMRIHPASTHSESKICGHYVNSILANLDATSQGYDEALLLDYKGNAAEGPGENLFIVEGDNIITPPKGNILVGITRDSIIKISKDLGYNVIEEDIPPQRVKDAQEAFYTGTAAEVTPIAKIDDSIIGAGEPGDATKKIKEKYLNIVCGKDKDYESWLTYINAK